MSSLSKKIKKELKGRQIPIPGFRPPWGELSGWGKARRVTYWVSILGQLGLLGAAMTSESDLDIKADGTKRAESEESPTVTPPPQPGQAAEDSADEKRDEPEKQEGKATKSKQDVAENDEAKKKDSEPAA